MVSSQVFEIIVQRYQGAIRRFLLSLTKGDNMLADDLSQETFIKAFYAWDTFAALSSPKTWLMRIAYTTFVDYTRLHHATETIEDEIVEALPSSSRSSVSSDAHLDIQHAMAILTVAERLCVELVLVEDRSIKQVAKITGLNENTVKSHLRRGKDKLKQFLLKNGYDR